MSAEVLRLRGVGVCRDRSMLLRDINWTVRDDQSWVIVGPNGAGKTTLLQVAAGLLLPTEGTAEVLGEPVDEADLAELRSRVGISSAAVAEQVPRGEKVIDLVMTAGYGILGRGSEDYDSFDVVRAVGAARRGRLRAPDQAPVRHLVGGRAQAGADRQVADGRPGAADARRAGRRAWTWAAARTC